jgi:rubrerythrin
MDQNTYKQIIADAIRSEIEAYEFYQQLSLKVKNAFLKELFHEFAAEELKHQKILQGFQGRADAAIHFARVPDYHVAETVDEPDAQLSIHMKPADAIAMAMKKEEAAMRRYSQLAEACTDPEQKKVFLELAVMERGHKSKMENAFVDIGYPEVW